MNSKDWLDFLERTVKEAKRKCRNSNGVIKELRDKGWDVSDEEAFKRCYFPKED